MSARTRQKPSRQPEVERATIPRVFHRVWLDEEVPSLYDEWWEQLRALHPEWELRSWERSSELDWLEHRALFDAFPRDRRESYAFRSDVARYEILLRFGGVYVDADVEPLRPFDELVDEPTPFVAWCSDEELDPSILGSPPGHPAMRAVVEALGTVDPSAPSPPGTTGPRFLTSLWRERDDVRRLPPIAFFPFHWRNMERERDLYPSRTIAVHHWAAGWNPKELKRRAERRR